MCFFFFFTNVCVDSFRQKVTCIFFFVSLLWFFESPPPSAQLKAARTTCVEVSWNFLFGALRGSLRSPGLSLFQFVLSVSVFIIP